MKQEFVTLPREVVEQALWALDNASTPHGKDWAEHGVARKALRAALDRLQGAQEPAPNDATHIQPQQGAFYKRVDVKWYAWSLMKNGESHRWYISPGTAESCLEPLAITPRQKHEPLTIEQPQAEQPAMTPIAQRKLDSMLTEGYTISGYSVYHERKHQHGFVTGAGLVGWRKPEGMEYPQPQGDQEPMFWYRHRSDGLYEGPLHKSQIERVRKESGGWVPLYTRPQPKREPLSDDDLCKVFPAIATYTESNKTLYRSIARAIEAAHNIK